MSLGLNNKKEQEKSFSGTNQTNYSQYGGTQPPNKPENFVTGGNATKRWVDLKKQYHFPWDSVSEGIQNSMKAIEDLSDSQFNSIPEDIVHLSIIIDVDNKRFCLSDVGVGFPHTKYLAHQETTRLENLDDMSNSGMGLGLSSILARSSFLKIITRNEEKGDILSVEITDFCDTMISEGDKNIKGKETDLSIGNSTLTPFEGEADYVDELPDCRFTILEVGGNHEDGLAIMWEWIEKHGIEKFVSALRYHTAIGHTGPLFGKLPEREIRWDLSVIQDGKTMVMGKKNFSNQEHFRQKAPKGYAYLEHNDSATSTTSHLLTYTSMGKKSTDKNHLKMDVRMICANREDGRDFLAKHCSEFLTHDDGEYEGDELSNVKSESSLVFLSIQGYPQPIRVQFGTSSNRTVDKWTLIFINVDRDVMDTGRRTIRDQYTKQINSRINEGLNKLNTKYTKDKSANTKTAGTSSQQTSGIGSKGKSKNPYGGKKISGLKNKNAQQEQKEGVDDDILLDELSADSEEEDTLPSSVSVLLREPKTEKTLDVLFINCLSVTPPVLEGIKIKAVGDTQTDLDFTIQPDWPYETVGSTHQSALEKKHTIDKDGNLSDVIGEMTIESKLRLKDLVTDLKKSGSSKTFETIDFGICWELELTPAQKKLKYRLSPAPPESKWHPKVTHILDMEDDPKKRIEIFHMKEFASFQDEEE